VCVRAMGREEPHNRVKETQETSLPTIGMDYDKYGEEEAVSLQVTTLVLKDSETGMLKGHVTEVKGPRDEWIVKKCCQDIEGLGHSNILLKTDGEPALVAVQSKIVARREGKTVPVNPPAYDPKSNGVIEKGVQDLNGRLRCIKIALEDRLKQKLHVRLPIFEWAVEHAAFVHNRYQLGHDGCTPYRRLTGRDWRHQMIEFGEQVMGKLAARRAASKSGTKTVHKNKVATKWVKGTWVGMVDRSYENIMITTQGKAVRVRTVTRRPEEVR